MAIKVALSSSNSVSSVSVASSAPTRVTTLVRTPTSQVGTNTKIEQMANFDNTDGLETGDTLVYNSVSGKWVPEPAGSIALSAIDGGTF